MDPSSVATIMYRAHGGVELCMHGYASRGKAAGRLDVYDERRERKKENDQV